MSEVERIWREKSDEDLIDAAGELDQFTEDGRRAIREELKRRGLEDPLEQSADETGAMEAQAEALECLRCHAHLRHIDMTGEEPARWHWRGERLPSLDPTGVLQLFACPECGHAELFLEPPDEDQAE